MSHAYVHCLTDMNTSMGARPGDEGHALTVGDDGARVDQVGRARPKKGIHVVARDERSWWPT